MHFPMFRSAVAQVPEPERRPRPFRRHVHGREPACQSSARSGARRLAGVTVRARSAAASSVRLDRPPSLRRRSVQVAAHRVHARRAEKPRQPSVRVRRADRHSKTVRSAGPRSLVERRSRPCSASRRAGSAGTQVTAIGVAPRGRAYPPEPGATLGRLQQVGSIEELAGEPAITLPPVSIRRCRARRSADPRKAIWLPSNGEARSWLEDAGDAGYLVIFRRLIA